MSGLGISNALTDQISAASSSQSTPPGGRIGKDEFLQLLVTQLSNQDPMNPMDGQEFAAQLAQFTSVEQLININESLAQSAQMNGMLAQSINSGVAAGLIGKSVQAAGSTVNWDGGNAAAMKFELASAAHTVTVTIRDADGNVVRTQELGSRLAGKQTFEWDGTTNTGASAGTGAYTFEIAATTAADEDVAVRTFTNGTVERITFGQDGIRLWLGSHSVAMSDVESVQ